MQSPDSDHGRTFGTPCLPLQHEGRWACGDGANALFWGQLLQADAPLIGVLRIQIQWGFYSNPRFIFT